MLEIDNERNIGIFACQQVEQLRFATLWKQHDIDKAWKSQFHRNTYCAQHEIYDEMTERGIHEALKKDPNFKAYKKNQERQFQARKNLLDMYHKVRYRHFIPFW